MTSDDRALAGTSVRERDPADGMHFSTECDANGEVETCFNWRWLSYTDRYLGLETTYTA